MEVYYSNEAKKLFESKFTLISKHRNLANKIERKINSLETAENLHQFCSGEPRCHLLGGDLKGKFAIWISGNVRLVFEPLDVVKKENGDYDWEQITKVVICFVKDYHKK